MIHTMKKNMTVKIFALFLTILFFLFYFLSESVLAEDVLVQPSATAVEAEPILSTFKPVVTSGFKRSQIFLGSEISSFSLPGTSAMGLGLNIGYRYTLTHRHALQGSLAQAFNASGGLSFLCTEFGLFFHYALSGGWIQPIQRIDWGEHAVISIEEKREKAFSLFLGAEQFLFSGKASVYPAPGFALGGAYQLKMMERNWVASLRYGSYSGKTGGISAFIFQVQTPIY